MKVFITTPIYYPNARPHIGSAYTTILADYLARLYRSLGEDVFFLTGMDEHGEKIQRTAENQGKSPKAFVDEMASCFLEAWKTLGISYDFFIRTSSELHKNAVEQILTRLWEGGWIYKGKYEGFYCVGCERYYTASELEKGCCPYHNKPVEQKSIEAYFFKLSAFENRLKEFYAENPDFLPNPYKEEVLNRVKDLQDLCISRPKSQVYWGIELPFDREHVAYVWVDALFNYWTGGNAHGFWPPTFHLIGKDILWFHTVIWPALLMACELVLPEHVIAHGFITVNKAKMSKSLGNVVDPLSLAKTFGSDALRYYLITKMSVSHDSDYSDESFAHAYNNELVADIGNLINRVVVLLSRSGLRPRAISPDKTLMEKCEKAKNEVINAAESKDGYVLLEHVPKIPLSLFHTVNAYLSQKEPWKLEGEEKQLILLNALEGLIFAVVLAEPLLPEGMSKAKKALGLGDLTISGLRPFGENSALVQQVPKKLHLYPKVKA